MRAIRIQAYGGPDVMQLVQKRRGELVGQAFYHRAGGGEPDLPATMGSQGVGMVEALGSEVTNSKVGARVAFWGDSYATHALVPAQRLIAIPEEITFEQAAAGMNQGFLAYVYTHFVYPIKPGDWCLVQAAAGGIGLLLCQMAKFRQGRVIGVTSTSDKATFVKQAGADEVILSRQPDDSKSSDIAKEVRRITDGRGVSVVYDGVGKDTFEANLDSLAPAGYLVIYGQSSGYVPPFDLMLLQEKGSLFLTRTNALPYVKEYPGYLQHFAAWIREGKLSIHIHRTYPLADAAQAHTAFEQRQVVGRALLLP